MPARALLCPLLGLAFLATATLPASAQADPFAAAAARESAEASARACQEEFGKLRGAIEKHGLAIKAANERKAQPKEACRLFRNFTNAEAKLIRFFVDKKNACQVPDQVLKQAKDGHAKAIQIRTQVCKVAESGGPQAPPPPSMGLSGALGSSPGSAAPDTPGSSGIFDTLTGNVLQR